MALSGPWRNHATLTPALRAVVGAIERPAKVTVTSSILDAHPSNPSDSPSTSVACTMRENSGANLSAVDPIGRPTYWPPSIGTPLRINVGDRVDQPFKIFSGVVDKVDGSAASDIVGVDGTDHVYRLEVPMSDPKAIAERMPPPTTNIPWLEVRVTSETIVDRAARSAGYYACAPAVRNTRLAVPMMGSLWPDVGTCTFAIPEGRTGPFGLPVLTSWGLAMEGVRASYDLTSSVRDPFEITMDLPDKRTGYAFVRVHSTDEWSYTLTYSHDNDAITVSTRNGPTTLKSFSIPRGGATRVAMRCTSTSISVRRDTDTSATTFTLQPAERVPSGWVGIRAQVISPGAIGGIVVSANPTAWEALTTARTARIRCLTYNDLRVATHTYDKTCADVLTEIAQAQCAAWWIDSNEVLQWAGRGVLESQTVSTEVTTLDSLQDLAWTFDRESTSRSVRMRREYPAIEKRTMQGADLDVRSASDIRAGDTWESWVSCPDDEDWIGVDTAVYKLKSTDSLSRIRWGSVIAMEVTVDEEVDSSAWDIMSGVTLEEVVPQRSYLWTVNPLLSTAHVLSLTFPDAKSVPATRRGRDGVILRGSIRVRWGEKRDWYATATTSSIGDIEFLHDAGRWVQYDSRATELRAYLAEEMGRGWPVLEQVEVRPDPRIEAGDRIILHDLARTGLRLTVIVQGVEQSWAEDDVSMRLTCRIQSWMTTGRVTAEPPSWLRGFSTSQIRTS